MGETNSPLVAHVGYDISPLDSWIKNVNYSLVVKKFNLVLLSGEIS
jgi:hypothetical protein